MVSRGHRGDGGGVGGMVSRIRSDGMGHEWTIDCYSPHIRRSAMDPSLRWIQMNPQYFSDTPRAVPRLEGGRECDGR